MAPPAKAVKVQKKTVGVVKTPKDAKNIAGPSKPTKSEPERLVPSDDDEEQDGEKDGDSDSQDSNDDDGGIDAEGMERLMKALGEDGLDEFEQMQLHLTLGGDSGQPAEGDDEEDSSDEEFVLAENASEGESSEEEAEADEGEGTANGDEDVALDEVESVDDDAVLRQKVEIDNTVALARIRDTIKLDPSISWTETLVLTYPDTIDVDVDDDLNREVAFYKQALHGANAGRALAAKHNFPFTRPADYFAEMVKSDAHMERIRQRLLDERAGIKKSEDKRKEREGKKFGKVVQFEKLKERERSKKEMEERLKGLKRKRGDMLDKPNVDDDAFDIAVEDAISDRPAKRGRGAAPGGRGGAKVSRQSRDKKFGFGGGGKRSKSNTRESTDDFGGFTRGGGRGGSFGHAGRGGARGSGRGGASRRLGKDRRANTRSKK